MENIFNLPEFPDQLMLFSFLQQYEGYPTSTIHQAWVSRSYTWQLKIWNECIIMSLNQLISTHNNYLKMYMYILNEETSSFDPPTPLSLWWCVCPHQWPNPNLNPSLLAPNLTQEGLVSLFGSLLSKQPSHVTWVAPMKKAVSLGGGNISEAFGGSSLTTIRRSDPQAWKQVFVFSK